MDWLALLIPIVDANDVVASFNPCTPRRRAFIYRLDEDGAIFKPRSENYFNPVLRPLLVETPSNSVLLPSAYNDVNDENILERSLVSSNHRQTN